MAYKVSKHNAFDKGYRKLDHQFKESFAEECLNIQNNPGIGEPLKGTLRKFDAKKVSIRSTNPEFRILYKVYNCTNKDQKTLICSQEVKHDDLAQLMSCEGLIDFIICGTREMFNNFYKLPLDRLKQYF